MLDSTPIVSHFFFVLPVRLHVAERECERYVKDRSFRTCILDTCIVNVLPGFKVDMAGSRW